MEEPGFFGGPRASCKRPGGPGRKPHSSAGGEKGDTPRPIAGACKRAYESQDTPAHHRASPPLLTGLEVEPGRAATRPGGTASSVPSPGCLDELQVKEGGEILALAASRPCPWRCLRRFDRGVRLVVVRGGVVRSSGAEDGGF